jgi:tetratricopeptide (TPR) repeat protein
MRNIIACCLVLLVTFGIFLSGVCPTVTIDDSGELSGVGATLGIAHSPGYPLYSLLGKLFTEIIPLGNMSYRMNLMSAVFVSLSASVLCLTVLELTGQAAIGILSALVFAVSADVWLMAVTTEVYGISMFFASLIIFLALARNFGVKALYCIALSCGLGVASHYTLFFLFPGLLALLYFNRKELNSRKLFFAFLFFALGVSVILYLPVRSVRQPLYDWEDPQTLGRFWQVVARLRYGSLNLAQGGPPPLGAGTIAVKTVFFCKSILQNVTVAGFVAGLLGVFYFIRGKQDPKKLSVLLLMLLMAGPGFLIMANVGLDRTSMALLKRFMHLSVMLWAVLLGVGLYEFSRKYRFAVYASFLIFLYALASGYNEVSCRNQYVLYDYGRNILRTLPRNALLFSDRADETEFCLSYLLYAEKKRGDVGFVDCNAGVSRSIYGDDYYRIWGAPRLRRREIVERGIIGSTKREVFYSTLLPAQTDIKKYQYGLLYNLVAPKKYFPWDEVYIQRGPETEDSGIGPMYANYFQLLGNYCLEYGDLEDAKRLLQGESVLMRSDGWIMKIAYRYYSGGKTEKAKELYRQALLMRPGWVEALCNLGVIYEKENRLGEAINCYTDAIKNNNDSAEAYYGLGVVYWKTGNWQKVLECFKRVLEIDPGRTDVRRFVITAEGKLVSRKQGD